MTADIDTELAAAQEALVRAMTAGGPLPPGFDEGGVRAAAHAILRKRAGEVARVWPALAASYGQDWTGTFVRWAAGRPTNGSLRDGWDFARAHKDDLDRGAALELALMETRFTYDAASAPRPRRMAIRRIPGSVAFQLNGQTRVIGRP
ncbi:hypothetical protein ACGFNU_12305 [Spirillospora sp. NPDC048911]|uniref:hypothetical protein n=1 Tax=Spirillospora sp. NPDC048911 TaxID=3364527 RepID=UPI0037232A47